MARHVRFSRQVAEADERVLRIRYPDWDQAESGPWQDWLRTWVKGGWATEGGALHSVCQPKRKTRNSNGRPRDFF